MLTYYGGIKMDEVKEIPVHVDELITAKCISLGKKRDGIFRVDGFVIIVPEAVPDKEYTIRITKVQPTLAFGKIEEE